MKFFNIEYNCDKKLEMEVKYEGFIYSCLLIFEEKTFYYCFFVHMKHHMGHSILL